MGNQQAHQTSELIHEFFGYYPDYEFCRTLALNIEESVTDYQESIEILSRKAHAAEQNREAIAEKLDQRTVTIDGHPTTIKDLSLTRIIGLSDDRILSEIVSFYLKHPYAHGRTRTTRLLPRWGRTLFLSALIGHAKRRGLELDYHACFDLLKLL